MGCSMHSLYLYTLDHSEGFTKFTVQLSTSPLLYMYIKVEIWVVYFYTIFCWFFVVREIFYLNLILDVAIVTTCIIIQIFTHWTMQFQCRFRV